jgi:hypothetical protein
MITAVTAFVPIPGHPRSEAEYRELGGRLLSMETKIPLLYAEGALDQCWLHRYLCERGEEFTHSVADNPEKNSPAYHIVQAQKSEWLSAAAIVDPTADVFCWLDFGIFHVPGITERIIIDFLQRAENERTVTIPGCWDRNYTYDDANPCWRFCGGVMLVPREYVIAFDEAMQAEYRHWLWKTGNVSWEVNTLARVEKRHPDLIWWYGPCDHDESMFTRYQTAEYADGQRSPRLAPDYAEHFGTI